MAVQWENFLDPIVGAGVVGWFALELLLTLAWSRALGERTREPMLLLRITALSVRGLHALGTTLLTARMLMHTGSGWDGRLDALGCTPLLVTHAPLRFSLSWSWWELVSVLRDLEGEGRIMLVHVWMMISSASFTVATGFQNHMVASMLITELSSVFLNPRLILLALKPKEQIRESKLFEGLTFCFGLSFLLIRTGFAFPRSWAHVSTLVRSYLHRDEPPSPDRMIWPPPCINELLTVMDVILVIVQAALNGMWSYKIVMMAARGPKAEKLKQG